MYKTATVQRQYQRDWINARKKSFLKRMGPCVFCGTSENIEIHHIDPERKGSHRIWSWSRDRILEELKSCVPLCRNCHVKFHALQKRKPLVHGTVHAYDQYACRCDECKSAKAAYRKMHEFK